MARLTEKQQQILDYITAHHDETGVFPSIREIATHMDFKSTNTVDYYLRQLEESGQLRRGDRRARTFSLKSAPRRHSARVESIRPEGIPLLGRVAAGQPILAEQNFDGMLNLGTMFRTGSDTFALKVQGDSMVEAGIVDGDMVIVRYQGRLEQGEIGVAIINEEATVKRIYDEGKQWRLQPENAALKPIMVNKSEPGFSVAGKVVGVLRKL